MSSTGFPRLNPTLFLLQVDLGLAFLNCGILIQNGR
jgi:hypothetical protein